MANKTREPLVHISRRSTLPWYQSWGIRACALILSLGVCALVTMFTTGENPLSVFGAIYDASFPRSGAPGCFSRISPCC